MKIYISYRRSETLHITERICDRLGSIFGMDNLIKGDTAVPLGSDFRNTIHRAVAGCDVALVIIGSQWLGIADDAGRRCLDNENDWIRTEIAGALSRSIPVIPLLVDGAAMPNVETLPQSIRNLAYRHSANVRADPDFQQDIERVVRQIKLYDSAFLEARKQPPSKWLMLGSDAAGKTSLLIALYGVLRQGLQGFTLIARDPQDDCDLSMAYHAMEKGETINWPEPTACARSWLLDMKHDSSHILTLEINDHRGGSLLERRSMSAEAQALLDHATNASVILLLVSGAEISDTMNGNPPLGMEKCLRLMARICCTERVTQSGKPPVIIIAITKSDLCVSAPFDSVLQYIRTRLSPFFAPGAGWCVAVCPITLGQTLGRAPSLQTQSTRLFDPKGVHIPLWFGVGAVISEAMAANPNANDDRSHALNELNRGLGGITVYFNGEKQCFAPSSLRVAKTDKSHLTHRVTSPLRRPTNPSEGS